MPMTESQGEPMGLRNRAGFALPLAIFIIVLLTMGLAAGLAATTADARANSAQKGGTMAFAIAQGGLERFMADRDGLCQTSGAVCASDPLLIGSATVADSIRLTMPGGYTDIVATRIQDTSATNNKALFFIRSHGIYRKFRGSSGDNAEHTVGVYATMSVHTINVTSAIMSLSGVTKSGSSGVISGIDNCGGGDTLAGLTVPAGDFKSSGGTAWAKGDPPIDTSSSLTQLKAGVGIDWQSIQNGAITADFEVGPDAFPSSSWFTAHPTAYPTIWVHTSPFSLPNPGRGLIIADGDFTISGSNMWNGVILIGGKLTSNGNNTMTGATVSGLNTLLGQYVDTTSISTNDNSSLNGNKTYLYDSCSVANATNGLRSYKALTNTWTDNVTNW